MVTVEQPLDVKLTMPNIDKNVTAGDTIPLTFQVMNLGRSTVYNVRCDVTGDGLSQTKTAFIGNMESGTAGEGETNLFITTLEGKSQYGDTTGTVTLTYEDGFGNEQTQEFSFNTTINKMPDEASTGDEKKEKKCFAVVDITCSNRWTYNPCRGSFRGVLHGKEEMMTGYGIKNVEKHRISGNTVYKSGSFFVCGCRAAKA